MHSSCDKLIKSALYAVGFYLFFHLFTSLHTISQNIHGYMSVFGCFSSHYFYGAIFSFIFPCGFRPHRKGPHARHTRKRPDFFVYVNLLKSTMKLLKFNYNIGDFRHFCPFSTRIVSLARLLRHFVAQHLSTSSIL